MNDTRKEKALFVAARELTDPAQRRLFLNQACVGDPQMRQRVEEMLIAESDADHFFLDSVAALLPSTLRQAAIVEQTGDRIGRYKLLEKLGEGGCGMVYVAEQEEPVRRRVALKVIRLGMDTKNVVARFEAERQALAMMDHPNIAKVLDAGATETGRPYFVMELVRGIKITEYCDQNHLPMRARLELFTQVCRAVQHAHQKGIIHRDLKPSNILVTLHDGVPVPKVIDFGIAKATEGRLTDLTVYTELHQFIGTPAYMSPEQAEMSGLDIDTRSDIYSLGVLLYELLTGITPFDGKELFHSGVEAMRRTLRDKEPVRPSTRLSTMMAGQLTTTAQRRGADAPKLVQLVRGDLDWIVMKCLEKDRTRRYETANGLASDIQRHLNQEPVVARPPSNLYRFQQFVRRNKLAVASSAAVLLSLVLGTAVAGWQAFRATRLGKQATANEHAARQAQREAEQEKDQANYLAYVANMNLAQAAWEQNNVGQVQQLLIDTAGYLGHSFEWYYWQRQIHLEIKTLRGHTKAICGVAFSPDGRRILTGSRDQTAKIWDAATGRELITLSGHTTHVNAVAFSPDGRRIATGNGDADFKDRDSTVKIWDAATGEPLFTLRGHSNAIYSVAFSPDGQRIVTGSVDQTARVWDLSSRETLAILRGHTGIIRTVAFSPDGQRIVTGSGDLWGAGPDSTARVWDAGSGVLLFKLQGHNSSIHAVAFSPNGQRIVTASWDGTAKLWEAASGKELLTLKSDSSASIFAAAFSADGERIVTGSLDQTATLWDANNGLPLRTFKGHSASITSVAFSPDGQRIVTGSGYWVERGQYTAKVWDAINDREVLTLTGHTYRIQSAVFSPDGQRILTSSEDGTARVWHAATGKQIFTLKGHKDQVHCAMFSPDGNRIITTSSDTTAKIWEAATGKELLTLTGHSNILMAAAFFPNGQRIVTGSHDGTARVWNATTGEELFSIEAHSGRLWCVAVSPDGKTIATVGDYRKGELWEAATGRKLLTLKGHADIAVSVAFSPDGQKIATGSSDRTAKVWDTATGQELVTLAGHGAQVWSVAFSPDGQRIVTAGSFDRTAKVWDTGTGKHLLTLKGHTAEARYAVFSPDGNRILTGSWDDTAKVWEAATVEQVKAWQAEESTGVSISPP